MAKINVPYVQSFTDRHGRKRFYYRRMGYDRVALPEPGSLGFLKAYEAAGKGKRSPGADRIIPKSIKALILEYYQSIAFRELKPQTQANYRNILDRFCEQHGEGSAVTIETRHFDKIFSDMADRPGAAKNLRKRLRKVFRHAVKLGWRRDNPVTESDAPTVTGPGFTPWTETHIGRFRKRWPSGTRERLAMELLLNTGVRRSDVIHLGRRHVSGGRIRLVQVKTGNPVTIPIHADLKAELALHAGETFITTQGGVPFSEVGFTKWFGDKADAAGCEGLTPHGLRKAAGRRLAEAGCSAKQIAAVLGHSSTRIVEVYTRDADRERLADAAFENLNGAQAVNPLPEVDKQDKQTLTAQGFAEESARPGRTGAAFEIQRGRLSHHPKRGLTRSKGYE